MSKSGNLADSEFLSNFNWNAASLNAKALYVKKFYESMDDTAAASDELSSTLMLGKRLYIVPRAEEVIKTCVSKKKYNTALDVLEIYWKHATGETDLVALWNFNYINNMGGNFVREKDQIKIIGWLGERIKLMERQAGRLCGSPVRLLGNLIFIILLAAGLWVLWTDPQIYAWLADSNSLLVLAAVAFLFCLLVWAATSFRVASCVFGAFAIISLGLIVNIPEEELLAATVPASKAAVSLAAAVLVLLFWAGSFLNNLYATTHIGRKASDRAILELDLMTAKDHIAEMLSHVETCDRHIKDRDESYQLMLDDARRKDIEGSLSNLLQKGLFRAESYYRYADSMIDEIAKKLR